MKQYNNDKDTRECNFCGEPLPEYATHRQRYCSEQHKYRMSYLKRKGYSEQQAREIGHKEREQKCFFCGKAIDGPSSKKFCCYDHWNLYRYYRRHGLSQEEIRQKSKEISKRKHCKLCRTPLDEKNAKARFCSKNHYAFFYYYKNKGLTNKAIRDIFQEKQK
jgi:predicted nucleic acid-binding Zn ribbon protein